MNLCLQRFTKMPISLHQLWAMMSVMGTRTRRLLCTAPQKLQTTNHFVKSDSSVISIIPGSSAVRQSGHIKYMLMPSPTVHLSRCFLYSKKDHPNSSREDIKTIPNLLTTLRMASAPLLAYLVVHDSFGMACSIFVLAGMTDLLDGYIARNFKNQRTALGTALDPLADKLLVSFLTVSLTSAGLIPLPVTVLILGRDAGLIAGTFYIRYISLAPPRTLARYFDVSHVTAKLYPSNISKINTVLQLLYVAATLASPVFDFIGHPLLQALMYVTAATTFLSGADYVLTWRKRLKIIKNR